MITEGVTPEPPDGTRTGRKPTASTSHAAGAPASWRAWPRTWRRWVVAARADDVFLYASALAFYGLTSVAPLVVVALWVTSLLASDAQVHDIADDLARLAPAALGADRAFERIADLGIGLGLLAVAAALWPATAYGSALTRVLDRLGRHPATTGLRGRGAALVLVALVPVLMLASLVGSYAGAATLDDSGPHIILGLVLAVASGFAATIATVAVIYRVFPRRPPPWAATLKGAVMAAGSISMLSAAYAAYLRLGVNFERRYASDALAAVILLGLWLLAANTALLLAFRSACRGGPSHATT